MYVSYNVCSGTILDVDTTLKTYKYIPVGSDTCVGGRPLRVRRTGSTANPAGVDEPVAGTRYLTSMIAASPSTEG